MKRWRIFRRGSAVDTRTTQLSEALKPQMATSEVLGLISGSTGEVGPIFQSLLTNTVRLCDATFGALLLCEGGALRVSALHNAPSEFAEFPIGALIRPSPNTPVCQMTRTKRVVHVAAITTKRDCIERDPLATSGVEWRGYQTLLAVPMLEESSCLVKSLSFVTRCGLLPIGRSSSLSILQKWVLSRLRKSAC